MAGIGGLATILLGALTGFIFAAIACVLVIYGFLTRKPGRGFVVSVVALALAVSSVLLSIPIWRVVLSGFDTHGEKLNYSEMQPPIFLMAVETLAILAAILGVVRHRSRRVP